MKIFYKLAYIIMLITALAFVACDNGDSGNDNGGGSTADTVVTIAAIPGVIPPAYGETPVTAITETAQYTGTVSWDPDDDPFDAETVYTATITLTAKSGYTLTGIEEDFFTVAGADTVSNDADSGAVTAVFPETGIAPPAVIDISAIPGVTPPAYGETPVTAITETEQYTGTVSWSPTDDPFDYSTVYIATITLTAKTGYTLTGVNEDFFDVAAATSVTNDADSGVVTVEFPATEAAPLIDVTFESATQTGGTSGTADSTALTLTFVVDPTTLTADNITVTGATKGALSGTGATRSLAISNITVANGGTVTVSITNPAGYSITGSPKTAVVYRLFDGTAGYKDIYTVPGVSFNMAYVPGGLTFPTGTNDAGTAIVTNAYWIAETEVTFELWNAVYAWATSGSGATGAGQYTFANSGGRGGYWDGDSYEVYTTGHETHPVTLVNWRDAMVWCNALTEWYNAHNGTSYACVYTSDSGYTTPIRDSRDGSYGSSVNSIAGSFDNPYVNTNSKGFRLLTSNEYVLAARYRGSDSTNTVSGYTNPYYTRGNSASGATTYFDNVTGAPNYAGKLANDAVAVYKYYWNGSTWVDNGNLSTASVKSKNANALGLYDMSGNVWVWCFNLNGGYYRMRYGGCWGSYADYLEIDVHLESDPYYEGTTIGFRFARTQ